MELFKLVNEIYKNYLQKANQETIEKIEQIDEELYLKKPKRLIVKDFRKRRIWTPETNILCFKRRRYFDKITKKYVYLLDDYLKIDKYKLISKHYQKLAIFYFSSFKNYQEIANFVFNGQISKMSIHNFIKNATPKTSIKNFSCQNDGVLVINADSLWTKQNCSKNYWEIKNLLFFTNRSYDFNNKKWKLENRTLKHFINVPFDQIVEEIKIIISHYHNIKEIKIVGDGAKWIKKLAKILGAKYYIDKFHYHKYIKDLVGRNFEKKNYIYQLFYTNLSSYQLKNKLLKIVGNYQNGEIKEKQMRIIGYLVNNFQHYESNKEVDYPISGIEAIQAHYQAKFFKNQRKGWNINVLNNLITHIFDQLNNQA